MPRERLPMRKIHEVLRLHANGLSKRQIAVSLNFGRTAVRDHIDRARRAGLSWPLPEGLTDPDLERLLFPPASAGAAGRRACPNWPALHGELKMPGVTLSLLWEEYRAVSDLWRRRSSSYSLRLPLRPSSKRSLPCRGA